jgi:hypothetical protein
MTEATQALCNEREMKQKTSLFTRSYAIRAGNLKGMNSEGQGREKGEEKTVEQGEGKRTRTQKHAMWRMCGGVFNEW